MGPTGRMEVTYCEGWDPAARAIVGVLPGAVARRRDEAGEQYSVLLSADERPYALIEVAWRHHYAGVWFFDQALRRAVKYEFRRLADDRLFLLETIERRYQSPDEAEFSPGAWRRVCRYSPGVDPGRPSNRMGKVVAAPTGASRHRLRPCGSQHRGSGGGRRWPAATATVHPR